MGYRDRRGQLVLIGLLAALIMQIALPYLPVDQMYGYMMPQVMVRAQVLPPEGARPQPSMTLEPVIIVTLAHTPQTPPEEVSVVTAQTVIPTAEVVDLVRECQ